MCAKRKRTTGMTGRVHVSSNNGGRAAAAMRATRRAPQHRKDAGRHREPSPTVAGLVAVPVSAGARLAAAGAIGTAAVVMVPAMASAAATGGPAGAPPAIAAPAAANSSAAPAPAPVPNPDDLLKGLPFLPGASKPTGAIITACDVVCGSGGVYTNGASTAGLGVGVGGGLTVTFAAPPTQSSVGATGTAAVNLGSVLFGSLRVKYDSVGGATMEGSVSLGGKAWSVSATYVDGQGWVWNKASSGTDQGASSGGPTDTASLSFANQTSLIFYAVNVPPQHDAPPADGVTTYPPGYQLPPANLTDWSGAFGPAEGGNSTPAPNGLPQSPGPGSASQAAPAQADPTQADPTQADLTQADPTQAGPAAAPAVPAVAPADSAAPAVPSAAPAIPAAAPVAPVYDPAIDTGGGAFSSTGLGTAADPLSGISSGIASDTGITSGLPATTPLPSVAPIDDPAISTDSTSFSSTDLGTSLDPVGVGSVGGFSGGATS
jgi:hypothetical protein